MPQPVCSGGSGAAPATAGTALPGFLKTPAASAATHGNRVGWWWLLGSYFLATAGELSLSPVGLSAMTRLAPERVASLMMGVWFLATSVGNFIG